MQISKKKLLYVFFNANYKFKIDKNEKSGENITCFDFENFFKRKNNNNSMNI